MFKASTFFKFILFTLLFCHILFAGERINEKIMFLYLKMNDGIISLKKTSIVNGEIKNRFHNSAGEILYIVKNTRGETVFSDAVSDPSILHYDYIDPADSDKLKGGIIKNDETYFMVRIPYQEGLGKIVFYNRANDGTRGRLISALSLDDIRSQKSEYSIQNKIPEIRAEIQLVQGDSVENRVHYCVFSEGYTQSELNSGKFIEDLKRGIDYQFSQTPYEEYTGHFTVWAISVASSQSGAGGYFESTWNGRLLYCQSNGMQKAYDLLELLKPNWDMGLILVNTTTYGGAGSEIAVSSINSTYSGGLIAHETGHGYAGLGDEYDDPGATPRENPNTTQETDRDKIKWRAWIEPSTPIPTPETSTYGDVVGLFEGAAYMQTGWYRPMLKCAMDWLTDPFCRVCTETIIARAYKNVSPADQYIPENLDVNYDDITDKELRIFPLQPTENTVGTFWTVNGNAVSVNSHTLDLAAVSLNQGENTIVAYVADTTGRIRISTNLFSPRDTITWNVTYGPSAIDMPDQTSYYSFQLNNVMKSGNYSFITFTLPSKQNVAITLFDSKGREVERLFKGNVTRGVHKVRMVNKTKISNGIYFILFSTDNFNETKMVQVLK